MATPVDRRRPVKEIGESAFHLLLMEMVNQVLATTPSSEAALFKLERMGYRVGQRLAARYTKEKPRFQAELEIIKFICKDFWEKVYKKQIDNLRTNHKGVFVLHDNEFRLLANFSPNQGQAIRDRALNYVMFPCGLIRGALASLGVQAKVHADISKLPSCDFTIKMMS
eukprot:TRINITY_DN17294_c0_g1_i1.p1 TRINITY_DN17294_c0_g1~~TRINITY_DN17294_c0_g1_i1.p1  ORF type:complete len:168 (-),score=44.49 TRINITY_DN17294_c0_g1_i1:183-686(-)